MNFVLDTNAIIYLQKGLLAEPLPVGHYFVSVVTEIELLSFPGLTTEQDAALRELLDDMVVVDIDDDVKREAIHLRRNRRLRLPDAIVLATAVAMHAELFSNDAALAAVPGARVRTLNLRPT